MTSGSLLGFGLPIFQVTAVIPGESRGFLLIPMRRRVMICHAGEKISTLFWVVPHLKRTILHVRVPDTARHSICGRIGRYQELLRRRASADSSLHAPMPRPPCRSRIQPGPAHGLLSTTSVHQLSKSHGAAAMSSADVANIYSQPQYIVSL